MITCKVYVDFDNDGTLVDISNYWQSTSGVAGIQDEMAHVANAGRCTVTLSNADKRFSPAYVGGEYYGKLLPGLPMQVEATDGDNTWTIFQGWTDSWAPVSGHLHSNLTCTLTGVDVIHRLQNTQVTMALQNNETADTIIRKVLAATMPLSPDPRVSAMTLYFNPPAEDGVASNPLYIQDAPANNDTVIVADKTYTFKTALTGAADEILIESGSETENRLTAFNLARAINRDLGEGTSYGTGTIRHEQVVAQGRPGYSVDSASGDTDIPLRQTGTNYTKIAGRFYFPDDEDMPNGNFEIDTVWLRLKALGSYVSSTPLIISIVNDAGGAPGGVLAGPAVAYVSQPIYTWYEWWPMPLASSLTLERGRYYWLTLSASVASSTVPGFLAWQAATGVSATHRRYYTDVGGASTAAGMLMQVGNSVDLTANAPGVWGNDLVVDMGTPFNLYGGQVGIPDLVDLDTGVETIEVAGDTWGRDSSGLSVLKDVVRREFGRMYVSNEGILTFKNQNWLWARQNLLSTLNLSSHPNAIQQSVSQDDIVNIWHIQYAPRQEESVGIVASTRDLVEIMPYQGTEVWNPSIASTEDNPRVVVPFVEDATGNRVGAKDIITPVAGTDYDVYANEDGTGATYNDDIVATCALTGGEITVTFKNKGGRKLWIHNLQVRGTALVSYKPSEVIVKDDDSIACYGKRAQTYTLQLQCDKTFAEAIGYYLLNRYKDATPRIKQLSFTGTETIDGVPLLSLGVGDTLSVSDEQTGLDGVRTLIIGRNYSASIGGQLSVSFYVRPLDDANYWVLENNRLSRLGINTRLVI